MHFLLPFRVFTSVEGVLQKKIELMDRFAFMS
jgi:hypothetical protein